MVSSLYAGPCGEHSNWNRNGSIEADVEGQLDELCAW